jgi:DNA-binding CsgD family transcriptional regulator
VKLAIAMLAKEDALHDAPGASHAPREIQVAVVVWEGLTNREIDRFIGTSEEMMKIQLRSTFDKPGVCRRLELAMDVASDGGKSWKVKPGAPPSGSHLRQPQAGGFSARRLFHRADTETKPMS